MLDGIHPFLNNRRARYEFDGKKQRNQGKALMNFTKVTGIGFNDLLREIGLNTY
jgi:hypothetical protein